MSGWLFETPHVVCSCGRIFFESQNKELWACARRHAEDRKALERAREEMQAMMRTVR